MTEAEWDACTDPQEMLYHLEAKASERKLRLFACACCRQNAVWHVLTDMESRRAVEASEQFADRLINEEQLALASSLAPLGRRTGGGRNPMRLSLHSQAARAALATAQRDAREGARETLRMTMNLLGSDLSSLLVESFGNPFQTAALSPSLLAWNDGAIGKMAQTIYEERVFDRLPILADALEDAGCTNAALLAHCRGPGEHVRGCWATDLILGKK